MARPGWYSLGYLPHCDEDGLVQHVVFRLADSLPASVLQKLELVDNVERFVSCDRFLDRGVGGSVLRSRASAEIVVDALLWFDQQRYALIAWCVMPNHVHVVVEPFDGHALSQIVKSWKVYTAARINRLLGRTGRLWAPEYFERFMRSDEHLSTTISYVEANPVAAGLCTAAPDWAFSSASARGEMRV